MGNKIIITLRFIITFLRFVITSRFKPLRPDYISKLTFRFGEGLNYFLLELLGGETSYWARIGRRIRFQFYTGLVQLFSFSLGGQRHFLMYIMAHASCSVCPDTLWRVWNKVSLLHQCLKGQRPPPSSPKWGVVSAAIATMQEMLCALFLLLQREHVGLLGHLDTRGMHCSAIALPRNTYRWNNGRTFETHYYSEVEWLFLTWVRYGR